jgi:type IV pilus assembly protein PilO
MSERESSPTLRERLASPFTWHVAAFVVLLLAAIALAVRLGFDWAATNSSAQDRFVSKQFELKALEHETIPLRGLDRRVDETRAQLLAFEQKRIPPNYSSIDARIGELQVASGVHLSHLQYTQGQPSSGLTEISIDAGISGDYPAIMRFINSIERDQVFFIIRTMALTGQQGGQVNLRLQLSTWLRPADAAASGLPSTPQPTAAPAPAQPPAAGREGE